MAMTNSDKHGQNEEWTSRENHLKCPKDNDKVETSPFPKERRRYKLNILHSLLFATAQI